MPAQKIEVIAILGGGIKKESGHWRTTNFYEKGDKFGPLGDYWRVYAASLLYNPKARQLFLALGGKGQLKDILKAPPVATIIKKELVNLGIPATIIKIENKSSNTFQQLLAIQKWQLKKPVISIKIISNQYHLSRIRAFLKYAPGLTAWKQSPNLLAAENIIHRHQPILWKKELAPILNSKLLKERGALEKQGCIQIKKGLYKYI